MDETSAVGWCLERVTKDSLVRLCNKRGLRTAGRKAALVQRLEREYGSDFDRVCQELLRDDLKRLVEAAYEGPVYGVSRANKADLAGVLRLFVVEEWLPDVLDDWVHPVSGCPINVAHPDSEWEEDWEDEEEEVGDRGSPSTVRPQQELFDLSSLEGSSPAELVRALAEVMRTGHAEDLRGRVIEIPHLAGADPRPLLQHQAEALDRVRANGWRSGIVHFPTGGGKTRTAMAVMAEHLAANPDGVVLWVTHGLTLIRQAMARVIEMTSTFPVPLRMHWLRADQVADARLLEGANLLFATRHTLTKWLERAADDERNPLARVGAGRGPRLLLVYDECHELGAAGLQKAWRAFHKRRVATSVRADRGLPVLGLSATPLPTSVERHRLLQETVFPMDDAVLGERPEWEVLVHRSVSMGELTERGTLCPMNTSLNEAGVFDIPHSLLKRVADRRIPRAPRRGAKSDKQWALEFSRVFNREVMGDPDVLQHLADRIAEHLDLLGKTVVFCASIVAAERLVALLKRDERVGRGRVTLVHSRMEDPELVDEDATDRRANRPEEQIAAFLARRNDKCVMVNVGMLTTGFDDPRIRSIVLARLTFSRNLFWQMIGRGLRGPETGGTRDCHVIDPVRLTDRFDVFNGYRPDVARGGMPRQDLEQGEASTEGSEDLAPIVTAELPAPPPDADMPGVRADVALALRAFLRGDAFEVREIAGALQSVSLELDGRGVAFRPASPPPAGSVRDGSPPEVVSASTFRASLERRLRQMEQSLDADLSWVFSEIPQALSESAKLLALRMVQVIEERGLRTRSEWSGYLLTRI